MDSPFYCESTNTKIVLVLDLNMAPLIDLVSFWKLKTEDNLYYRIMIGNPDGETGEEDALPVKDTSCKILASLFSSDKTVRVYKYSSGPIVIFWK